MAVSGTRLVSSSCSPTANESTTASRSVRVPRSQTRRTVTDYAVPRAEFPAMTTYGTRKERATVLIRRGK